MQGWSRRLQAAEAGHKEELVTQCWDSPAPACSQRRCVMKEPCLLSFPRLSSEILEKGPVMVSHGFAPLLVASMNSPIWVLGPRPHIRKGQTAERT